MRLGTFVASESVRIGYRLEGEGNKNKVVILQGFAALYGFAGVLIERLLAMGCEVLTYDHRGLGKSICPVGSQTTSLLAWDAGGLLDHVWGPDSQFHIIGISMGGMVVQELLYLLAEKKQSDHVLSASLICTTGGTWLRQPPFVRWYVTGGAAERFNGTVEDQITKCLNVLYHTDFLAEPDPSNVNQTRGEALVEFHRQTWNESFQFQPAQGFRSALTAIFSHYLSPCKAKVIRDAGMKLCVFVTGRDHFFTADVQRKLAAQLGAGTVEYPNASHCSIFVMDGVVKLSSDLCTFMGVTAPGPAQRSASRSPSVRGRQAQEKL